jgi:hypothetical protein
MHARSIGIALLGGLALQLASWSSARAQRAVDLERLVPAADGRSFLGVQGSRTPGPGRPTLGFVTGYASQLLEVELSDGSERALLSDRITTWLSAELGVGRRAAVGFSTPLVLFQDGQSLAAGTDDVDGFGVGDTRLQARYRLLGAVAKDALDREDGPGLALAVSAFLPSGDDDRYVGEGAYRGEAQLLMDLHLLGAGLGAQVGVRHRFEERELLGRSLRSELTFGAAARVPIPPLHPLVGLIEVRGASDFASSETTAVEGQLGVILPFEELTFMLAGGPGLSGAVGVPTVRVVAGLWYAPKDADADGDGVPDDRDACPPLPEDLDGYEDDDGCPDPDNDNDLIPDADDLCPNVEALEGQDDDEDGCTDEPK